MMEVEKKLRKKQTLNLFLVKLMRATKKHLRISEKFIEGDEIKKLWPIKKINEGDGKNK